MQFITSGAQMLGKAYTVLFNTCSWMMVLCNTCVRSVLQAQQDENRTCSPPQTDSTFLVLSTTEASHTVQTTVAVIQCFIDFKQLIYHT